MYWTSKQKKPEKYMKHVIFSVQIAMVGKICFGSGKSQGIFFIPMCGNPATDIKKNYGIL